MEDWDIPARKEIYSGLHDRVQSIGHEGWYKWFTCHLFVEEKYVNGNYQDDTGIFTNDSF